MKFSNLAVVAAAFVLTACGGGGNGGGGDPAAPPGSGVLPAAHVAVALSLPGDPVPAGQVRWYDVTVTNDGPEAATDVRVQASYTASLAPLYVDCAAAGGAECPALPESMSVALLPAQGTLRFRVYVRHQDRGAATITTTVAASNDTAASADHQARIDLHAYTADLHVTAEAPPGELPAGAAATFIMSVDNDGPDAAHDVAIHNFVDANLSLQGLRCAAEGGAVCPASIGPAMSAPLIPVGGVLRFTVDTMPWPTTVGPVTNTLQVSALGDPDIYDNSAVGVAHVALPASPGSLVVLDSDAGDYVGQGQTYVYDAANSLLQFDAVGARLNVSVSGDTSWNGSFQLPGGLASLQPGTYLDLTETQAPPAGGLSWSGDGRACASVTGWVVVDDVAYSGATLTRVDLRFEQHCEGVAAALRGRVRWDASDTTQPPGPIVPPPADLWRAPEGTTPAQGSYFYVQREPYDPLHGSAASQVFTRADSVMSVAASGPGLSIRVHGDSVWAVDFRAMQGLAELQPGYYRGLAQQANPARGLLSVSLQGCDKPTGWVVIDDIHVDAGVLSSVDLRFEQHCAGSVSLLHGQMRWIASETTQPPGPQAPPPGLWSPRLGSTPAQGNYVYLESDPGDYIGQGQTRLFDASNSAIAVTTAGIDRRARVRVNDGMNWGGEFYAMSSVPRLQPGFYFGVQGVGAFNPARGGLAWSGEYRACNTLWGWFVIDDVRYEGDELTALDARFEQHCEYAEPALRGKVHWAR